MAALVIDPRMAGFPPNQVVLTGKTEALPQVAVGEALEAHIVQKLSPGKYLLALKNATITASSDLPLKAGEKIQVRVAATGPQILLSVFDPVRQSVEGKLQEHLIHWRANPDALLSMMNRLAEFSQLLKSEAQHLKMTADEITGLIRLFDQMIFSPRTKTESLFVRNFLNTSGLLMEKALGDIASSAARGAPANLTDNLKAAMLRLTDQIIRAQAQADKLQPQILDRLQNLASLTSEALKTIEARQAVNVVFQQNDQGLYLQIPVALGDMLRLADVFIRSDDGKDSGETGFANCTITIFLSLDFLGDISIEARLREGNFRCIISCEDDSARSLIDEHVDQLWIALEGLGYRVDALHCLKVPDIQARRGDFMAGQSFSEMNLINFFA